MRDIASNTVDTRISHMKHEEAAAAAAAAAESGEDVDDAIRLPPPIDFYIYPDLVTYATEAAIAKIDGGRCIGKAYISVNHDGCTALDLSDAGQAPRCAPMIPPKPTGPCCFGGFAPKSERTKEGE